MRNLNDEKLVSIIIPTCERLDRLRETINSLKRYEDRAHILIINDCADPLPDLGSKVEIIELGKNFGEAHAVNVGWHRAHSKYVSVISDDDPQIFEWLDPLLESAETDSNFVAWYPNTAILNEKREVMRIIEAKAYSKSNFYDFLSSPCLAGVLINREYLQRVGLSNLRVAGMYYPNDLVQWLELGTYGQFQHVTSSTSCWVSHSGQISQKLTSGEKAFEYYLNISKWQLEKVPSQNLSRSLAITLLRAFQLTGLQNIQYKRNILVKHLENLSTFRINWTVNFFNLVFLIPRLVRFKYFG